MGAGGGIEVLRLARGLISVEYRLQSFTPLSASILLEWHGGRGCLHNLAHAVFIFSKISYSTKPMVFFCIFLQQLHFWMWSTVLLGLLHVLIQTLMNISYRGIQPLTLGTLLDGYLRTNQLPQVPTRQSVPTSKICLPPYFGLPIRIPMLSSICIPTVARARIP